jgi:hypothetical protein
MPLTFKLKLGLVKLNKYLMDSMKSAYHRFTETARNPFGYQEDQNGGEFWIKTTNEEN